MDAELLDEELLELLKGQVGEGLRFFGVCTSGAIVGTKSLTQRKSHLRDEWSPEIFLALRAVLFKLSIWDHNAFYGAALQNLRYTDARHAGLVSRVPSRWQKSIYGLTTVGGRYVWEKWENWLTEREGGYDEVFRSPHYLVDPWADDI